MVESSEFLNMKVHDTVSLPDGTKILRVMDGWIYTFYQSNRILFDHQWFEVVIPTAVFVPIIKY